MVPLAEPLLDFLQRTLGKPGDTHNHPTAFRGVFLTIVELRDRLSSGDFRPLAAQFRPFGELLRNATMPRFPNQDREISASEAGGDQLAGSVAAFQECRFTS